MTDLTNINDYQTFLKALKNDIQTARLKAHLAVNKELILLYWRIGKEILDRQKKHGWGAKIIDQLAVDLKLEFPDMKGFGARNLVYMRTFANVYQDYEFTQAVPAQLSWYHHQTLLDKVSDEKERIFYMNKTIENGWSRNVLVLHIQNNLYATQGKALTNFKQTLPAATSDLAQEIFKSDYNFEFLKLTQRAHEREIESALIENMKQFLLALGTGFGFLGSQYKIVIGGDDFFIDLLFYHVRLKSYVVIELKAGSFKPEYAGKLGFYAAAIDGEIKAPEDHPTIGLLLCQSSNQTVVEYCLSTQKSPIGISGYKLPKDMQALLPSEEQLKDVLKKTQREVEEGIEK